MNKLLIITLIIITAGCTQSVNNIKNRLDNPPVTIKVTQETDSHPLIMHSNEYEQPIPLPHPINTAGAEDSPFITPDGNTLYFFYTPNASAPVNQQLLDGLTGIYVTRKINNEWTIPERVILQDEGKLALDGCAYIQGNTMHFCSAREGYTGVQWFKAEYNNGEWIDWGPAGFNESHEVGELHIHDNELYYHSRRSGGVGGMDVWVLSGEGEPVNIHAVNSEYDEGYPAISPDGQELWITRNYGLWRSIKINSGWGEPELIISPLAGEASIDEQGNIYFTHHYYEDDEMIEADIYVAYKK